MVHAVMGSSEMAVVIHGMFNHISDGRPSVLRPCTPLAANCVLLQRLGVESATARHNYRWVMVQCRHACARSIWFGAEMITRHINCQQTMKLISDAQLLAQCTAPTLDSSSDMTERIAAGHDTYGSTCCCNCFVYPCTCRQWQLVHSSCALNPCRSLCPVLLLLSRQAQLVQLLHAAS